MFAEIFLQRLQRGGNPPWTEFPLEMFLYKLQQHKVKLVEYEHYVLLRLTLKQYDLMSNTYS